MDLIDEGKAGEAEQLLIVMTNGYGKRTSLKAYKVQGRGGSGIKTAKITDKTGKIVSAMIIEAKAEHQDIIVISQKGQVIRTPYKAISVLGRDTQGVRIMKFNDPKDRVANVTLV
jgi:DNA gyrase subunit A